MNVVILMSSIYTRIGKEATTNITPSKTWPVVKETTTKITLSNTCPVHMQEIVKEATT